MNNNIPFPLIAQKDNLNECLSLLKEKPLKLVANSLYKKFNETKWDNPKWSFTKSKENVTNKNLLPNKDDLFQFSVANERSKQDFHYHEHTYEIYISDAKIEISYMDENSQIIYQEIDDGVLIVPPNLRHKVRLYGFTFVLQASLDGSKGIDADKIMVNIK